MIGLIGYTGTVGSHLREQYIFDELYNSKNIKDIHNKEFDLLIIAGIRAAKYIANSKPDEDLKSINDLLEDLKFVRAKKVILISTIDVHNDDFYGKHRAYAELEISKLFDTCIIRLPGLVGKHIKKNFIYDICHNKDLSYTSINSSYEFMNLEDLHKFIDLSLINKINLLEIRSEPISTFEICKKLNINTKLLNTLDGVNYTHIGCNYYSKEQELEFISEYVQNVNFIDK